MSRRPQDPEPDPSNSHAAWRGSILWGPVNLLGLMAALWVAWWLLAQASFAYPLWYDWMAIDAHIQEYGPKNRYRDEFASTDRDEHLRLFAAIVESIHDGGRGLDAIDYRDPDGRVIDSLLRPPEVVHLQDVARLVDLGRIAGLLCLGLWLVSAAALVWRRRPMPAVRHQLLGLLAVVLVATVGILIAGPVAVFYAVHEWVFPPDHEWFFYYQDSLMTTLMKAPDLFGGMAAQWLLLALLLVALQLWGLGRLLRRRLTAP